MVPPPVEKRLIIQTKIISLFNIRFFRQLWRELLRTVKDWHVLLGELIRYNFLSLTDEQIVWMKQVASEHFFFFMDFRYMFIAHFSYKLCSFFWKFGILRRISHRKYGCNVNPWKLVKRLSICPTYNKECTK